MVAIGIACTAAFSVRSNGIFLFACAGVALLVRWLQVRSVRALVADALTLGIVGAIGCAAYFLLLPDGSHTQTRFLDFSISSIVRRTRETTLGIRDFVPFVWWPSTAIGLAGIAATMLLALAAYVRGIWTTRLHSAIQLCWVMLNFALLAVFKYDGGTRYLFPLLLPLYIFSLRGVLDVATAFRRDARPRSA